MDLNKARKCLADCDFTKLFVEELGWDRHVQRIDLTLDGQSFTLAAVAHKRGMVAFLYEGKPPDYPTRRKIERQVAKNVHEHLLIFTDPQRTTQIWQWVKREPGKPLACREHTHHRAQPGDSLIQKLQALAFSIEDEESLTIVDVTGRVRAGFDVERVTKRFYDKFKDEHAAFLDFIKGIPVDELHRWYASVMLNRLMFVYFIQKKGFLNGDPDYLRNKLAQTRQEGKNRFYSDFICPLFFEGFAKKAQNRSAATNQLLGKVPYLNGGIFQRHQIEELHGETIKVSDTAFERLFDFFDLYRWHLDERPLRQDNEINPDVLGYIFEKYINQKQMGAYYTKEDITGYIGAYTIVPFLFEVARAKCKVAFEGDNSVWTLIQADPDRYIYPAVKKGVELKLPDEIAAGIKNVSKRTEWNKRAPAEYALPTEIWREVVARRQRYAEIKSIIQNPKSQITTNDFITYNLDIRQFAQDVIENSEPDLLSAIYAALLAITVLDPTCGSGAFLFAALNILYPLYEACLNRMALFVAEWERTGSKAHPNYSKNFKAELNRLEAHHSEPYFILKTIIVNNLYGVDIMDEAVEICKLRLFLKLVAQIESADHIEPLPDIDFNIRAGNTLIGYATYDEVKRAVTSKLDFDNAMAKIEDKAALLQSAFEMFRRQQTELGGEVTAADKRELRKRLEALENELNRHLATEYGVDVAKPPALAKWLHSHKPFHWFIEFYGIMKRGGFDVIVGNPPYAEIPKDFSRQLLRNTFTTSLDKWSRDEDLYTLVVERSLVLLVKSEGKFGMILPLSIAFSTKRSFVTLRQLVMTEKGRWYWSHFDRIPSALFGNEVRTRCTIGLLSRTATADRFQGATTPLLRWNTEFRDYLFQTMSYATFGIDIKAGIPKVGSQIQADVLQRLLRTEKPLVVDLSDSIPFEDLARCAPRFPQPSVYVGGTAYNWFPAWRDIPETTNLTGRPSLPARTAGFIFANEEYADIVFAFLCSSLGYWWWAVASDGFNLKKWLLERFPLSVSAVPKNARARLAKLGEELRQELRRHYVFKDNKGRVGNYFLPACEAQIVAIDEFLAANIPNMSIAFFQDIRSFNMVFSRAESEVQQTLEDEE